MQPGTSSPIICAGELLWDLLPGGPRLGGTTTNFAILSARLGNHVALVSRLGEDKLGLHALAQLQEVAAAGSTHSHLDLRAVQWSQKLRTGTVTVDFTRDQKPRYTIESPVAWDEIMLTPELLKLAETASAICYGTLAQRHSPSRETIRALLQATTPSCVRICDVNLRMPFCTAETLHWCLRQATVLKISDEELPDVGRLLNIVGIAEAPTTHGDELTEWAQMAASLLLERTPRCHMVAITLGAHGSLLLDRSRAHRHHGYPVDVVDTIGAGDAFTAGMVHAFLRGASLEQINTISNLCGSYVAGKAGATPELTADMCHTIQTVLCAPAT